MTCLSFPPDCVIWKGRGASWLWARCQRDLVSNSCLATYPVGGGACYLPSVSVSSSTKWMEFMIYNIVFLIEWLQFLNDITNMKCFIWCLVKHKYSINVPIIIILQG